jgi:hypothetical protein
MKSDLSMFTSFPDNARTWVYQSSRELTEDEAVNVSNLSNAFVKEWKAHGQPLKAATEVLYNRFLVMMVDEDAAHASGCSIDSSVAFIRSLQTRLNVDFFDRLQLAYVASDGLVRLLHVTQLETAFEQGEVSAETKVFNNMVTSNKELRESWRIPLSESWAASRLLNVSG